MAVFIVPDFKFHIVITRKHDLKGSILSISVGSKPEPLHFLLFFQASTTMFPKMFQTTLYTEQGTVCPVDLLLFNPPATRSVYRDQPQAEYHSTSSTIDSDTNRVQASESNSLRKTGRTNKNKKLLVKSCRKLRFSRRYAGGRLSLTRTRSWFPAQFQDAL